MTTKPRKLQEIFNAVIEAGHYPYEGLNEGFCSSNFMCEALKPAKYKNVITEEELDKAKVAIATYISRLNGTKDKLDPKKELPMLWRALFRAGLVDEYRFTNKTSQPILLAIYKNWAKRPFPKNK